jgi:hypothetical protein
VPAPLAPISLFLADTPCFSLFSGETSFFGVADDGVRLFMLFFQGDEPIWPNRANRESVRRIREVERKLLPVSGDNLRGQPALIDHPPRLVAAAAC